MYPAAFEYHAPKTLKEALNLLKLSDSKLLAGGHSLIPMMKLRLAQPKHIIDLGKIKGLMTTAVKDKEVLTTIRIPVWAAGSGACYMKFPHPASRFAIVGVCAAVTVDKGGVCKKVGVGVTGAGTKAVRAKGVEAALLNKKLDAATIEAAAQKAADGVDVQADLQGSVEYKAHLCRVFARRALEAALKRAQG